MWDLQAYVTSTEWEWMHGNLLITSVAEVDLERVVVYESVCKYTPITREHTNQLLKRGSLCVLQTPKVRHIIAIWYPTELSGLCMRRPLSIVQYFTRLMRSTTQHKYHIVTRVIIQAIYTGRRDVIAWIHEEFPSEMEASFRNSCEYAIYEQQAWTIRWMCQKYNIDKQYMCDKGACFAAVRKRQIKVLQWLRRGRSKCPWDQPKCLEEAQKRGYTEIAAWIRRQPI